MTHVFGQVREGLWAQDVVFDRALNLSKYSNVSHSWALGRRLKTIAAFVGSYSTRTNGPVCIPRTNRDGNISIYLDFDGSSPKISNPSDDTVFRNALCAPNQPWPFDRGRKDDVYEAVALEIRNSDKGQYLEAILNRAGGLNQAEEIFLHRFWRDRFEELGASPAATERRLESVKSTLKKRLRTGQISSDTEWERLAKLVLQEAHSIKLFPRYVRFSRLEEAHHAYADAYWQGSREGCVDAEWRQEEKETLPNSTQYLVGRKILHQGLDWRCLKCANSNWTNIDNIRRNMRCEVCGRDQAAPVSFEWNFKLDGFILEGLRDHGLLANIWCLSRLSDRARTSFYFCPSKELYYSDESCDRRIPDAEIDILAVVDGATYACEVKSSSRQFDHEKFVDLAARIRCSGSDVI